MWRTIAAAVLALAWPVSAGAQANDDPQQLVKALLACRQIEAAAARLACFDRAAGELRQAQESGLVVLDKAGLERMERRSFGLSGGATAVLDKKVRPQIPNRINTRITTVGVQADGRWLLTLADESVWLVTEDSGGRPRPEQPIEITRQPLGNFMATIGKGMFVRLRRVK